MNRYLILRLEETFSWINITNFSNYEVSFIEQGIREATKLMSTDLYTYRYPEHKEDILQEIEESNRYAKIFQTYTNSQELKELLEDV